MRVPNISNYVNATYRLGNLTSDLQKANEVVSTQKQLNEISDNPIGLSQVLSLKNSLGSLEQIEQNVIMGKSWIESIENALTSANDLILEAKVDIARLANDSTTQGERRSAIERINSYIEQITSLGNTQVNGNYIFGGKDIDTAPLTYDKTLDQVIYSGSDEGFEIRSDKNSNIFVGRNGKDTFWDEEIHINTTNNTIMFKEDNGHGNASEKVLKAVVPEGVYTKQALTTAIKNELNAVSADAGYGLTYEVAFNADTKKYTIREDGSYNGYIRTQFLWETGGEPYINKINASTSINPEDINIDILHPDTLTVDTPEPHGTEPFRLTWTGDNTWEVDNNPGYVIIPSTIPGTATSVGIDLDESGVADIKITLDTPVSKRGQFIEFDIVSYKGDHSTGHEIGFAREDTVDEPIVSDQTAQYVNKLEIRDGVNDKIVFEEVDTAGGVTILTADIAAVDTPFPDMDTLAKVIETQMESVSGVSGNSIDYAVTYDPKESRFNIRENGTRLDELNVLWNTDPVSRATAATLGYYPFDDHISYPASDNVTHARITVDETNNMLYFRETGGVTRTMGVEIPSGTYTDMSDLETAIETAMNSKSALSGNSVTYDVLYDNTARQFEIQRNGGGPLIGLDLLWNSGGPSVDNNSIGATLGFTADDTGAGIGGTPYTSDTPPVLMTFDNTNNAIDFREVRIDGTISEDIHVMIPAGEYTDLNDVAAEVQTALREDSPNGVRYRVNYDYAAGQFQIIGSSDSIKSFSLLWQTGVNRAEGAGDMLGFYGDDVVNFSESDAPVVNLDIGATNNKIDFREILSEDLGQTVDQLTASIAPKVYTSHEELAKEVEKALEAESLVHGHGINYSVTWDAVTRNFSIKENGSKLEQLDLMWKSGDNAPISEGGTGQSIGNLLGFDPADDVKTPMASSREVEWGIFDSLIDLKAYLSDNDRDGIERTIGRLEQNFDLMTSRIVDAGMKYSRLEIRQTITTEVGLNLTERKSMIEDADIVESIMNLMNIETAYQAALNSTSRIINVSLVDYL